MTKTISRIFIITALIAISMKDTNAQIGEPTPGAIANMKTEEFTFNSEGVTMKGYVAYVPNEKQKLPVVLVVPEWWGFTDYPKMRARKLAELGYIAMVVDMYGDGKIANNPDEAQKLATPFYKDPQLAKARLAAAEVKIKTYPQADPRRIAAIGYCFGGTMVLQGATQGMDFRAVVSFHGGLKGLTASRGAVGSKIFVCQGGDDKFVPKEDVDEFKRIMDAAGVKYILKVYPHASHAFSNPEATANGKKFNLPIAYNEEADKNSWQDMRKYLREIFYSK